MPIKVAADAYILKKVLVNGSNKRVVGLEYFLVSKHGSALRVV